MPKSVDTYWDCGDYRIVWSKKSPTITGLIMARALSPEPGQMAQARRSLEPAQCGAH